jgi:hypothetical protein
MQKNVSTIQENILLNDITVTQSCISCLSLYYFFFNIPWEKKRYKCFFSRGGVSQKKQMKK